MALPDEDRALLQDTLVSLSVEDTVINEIMTMLDDQSAELSAKPPTTVQGSWFGDSRTGGYRLATNTVQASGVVEDEMHSLIIGLRQYRDSIEMFANDVKETDENIAVTSVVSLARIENAANCTDGVPTTTCTAPTENS